MFKLIINNKFSIPFLFTVSSLQMFKLIINDNHKIAFNSSDHSL